ncbi:hypothetical protein [Lactobacillus brevis] [Lactiplantibacillus mudanjiangensis]|uniref:EpsG family protein n=1 Tax=Lactiplantibacillus mudanjiangensis TaxID=1296538 RepID=UPI001015681C|nr:EpsG family protein [Lactiplantibacillus mudanjiangensis]VDG32748.1 hypothetical protein [Lactobacillus brevis] [Lactiplantibacillus mudanjiangensis]
MLYISTMIICLVASLFLSKTKVLGFLALMVLAYFAGAANPLTTIDYPVYLNHYNLLGSEVSPFEKGYTQLSLLFFNHGFDYASFRICFAFLACLILFLGVSLFIKNIALFASIYGLTVFFNDATQIRNLMMISLVILGAGLLTKKKRSIKLLGILILWFSTQFHDLGFIFLLSFVILYFMSMALLHRLYKYIVFTLFGLGFIFSVAGNSSVVKVLASFLSRFSSRSDSAANVINSFGRGTSTRIIVFMWIALIIYSLVLMVLLNAASSLDINKDKLKILFIGSSVSMTVAFLIVLAPDYSRISRNAFLFLLILLCMVIEHKKFLVISFKNAPKIVLILALLISTTYVNTSIWGSVYYDSIPYLAKIKK